MYPHSSREKMSHQRAWEYFLQFGCNCGVEPLIKDTPVIWTLQTLSCVPNMLSLDIKFTPEVRTPLYTGHFTKSPRCPQ